MTSSVLTIFTSLYFLTSAQVFPKKILFINLYRLSSLPHVPHFLINVSHFIK